MDGGYSPSLEKGQGYLVATHIVIGMMTEIYVFRGP